MRQVFQEVPSQIITTFMSEQKKILFCLLLPISNMNSALMCNWELHQRLNSVSYLKFLGKDVPLRLQGWYMHDGVPARYGRIVTEYFYMRGISEDGLVEIQFYFGCQGLRT